MKDRSTSQGRFSKTMTRGVALMLVCWAGQAVAQQIVHDPVNFTGQLRQIAADAVEFGTTAKRWTQTADHYRQQVIRLQRLNFGAAQMSDSFPPRAADYGMQDECPGEGGIKPSLDGAFKAAMPQMQGDVIEQQRSVCQRLVYARNMKYNESVHMLRTLIARNRQFQQLEQQRDQASSRQGDLAANDNEAQRFLLRTSMELDYWQARMKAYDDYIVSLQHDQTRLANRALGGDKSKLGIGSVVQAGVLAAALTR